MCDGTLFNNKEKCSGCGLCAKKCPKNAITMKTDEAGFFYPYINKNKCINCGICKKICDYSKNSEINENKEKECYIAFSKDVNILKTTASGGAFSSIAKAFIENDGIVYGAALLNENDCFCVKHIRITSTDALNKIKGSKYLQSNIYDVYEMIKEDIKNNKRVLFSGTPCQVAAIKKYIGENEKLYTIDIICHGVPNNKMFNDYINKINKIRKINIKKFNFRDKSKGWGLYYYYNYYDRLKKKNYEKVEPAYKSSYYQLFLDSYLYRINCYSCPYANANRVSDITIGDYWGIEQEYEELIKSEKIDTNKGVSSLIINTQSGKKIVEKAKNNLHLYNSDLEIIKKHNMQLNKPCELKKERSIIVDNYVKNGYDSIEKFYIKKYGLKIILKNIWFKIPKKIRKKIKK